MPPPPERGDGHFHCRLIFLRTQREDSPLLMRARAPPQIRPDAVVKFPGPTRPTVEGKRCESHTVLQCAFNEKFSLVQLFWVASACGARHQANSIAVRVRALLGRPPRTYRQDD